MESTRRNSKSITLQKFDPEPSGRFAHRVLEETKVRGVLIGRLAVWAWVVDPSRQAFTKDVDIAIFQADQGKIVSYLTEKGLKVHELSIGGINVSDEKENVKVDFIHRYSKEWGDLSKLFEEAVEKAIEIGYTVNIGEASFFLVTVEHLICMKIATMEMKDEEDVFRILETVDKIDVEKLRKISLQFLGEAGKIKLEKILREAHHPEAYTRGKYMS